MKRISDPENALKEIFIFHANNIHEKYKLPISIWQLDKRQNNLIIAASAGFKTKYQKKVMISLTESSVTGDVFKKREMEVVKDIIGEKRWKYKQDAKALGLKSAICVPIIVEGQSKGVITVYTTKQRSDVMTFKNFLESVASQIGKSIEVEIQQAALKKLLSISEKIKTIPISKGISPILKTIVEGAQSTLGANLVDLYVHNEDNNKINLPPIQVGKRKSKPPTEIKKDDVVNQLIFGDNPLLKPIYIEDSRNGYTSKNKLIQKKPNIQKKQGFVEREEIVSTAIIPLVVVKKVMGILFVNYKTPQKFTDNQKELILSFANQASFALSNYNLSSKKTKRDEAIFLFNDFAESIGKLNIGKTGAVDDSSKLPSQKLLQKIADGAQEVLGADLVDLYQYRQSLDKFTLPIVFSGKNRKHPLLKEKILKDDYAYNIINGQHPKYIANVLSKEELTIPHPLLRDGSLEKPVLRFVVREAIISMAAVPMKIGNEIVGVMFISYRAKQNFPDSKKKMIEQFAVQAATAIRAVRLFEQRQALVDFGNEVSKSQNLSENEILELVRAKASDIMDAKNMYIALYDKEPGLVRFGLLYKDGEIDKVSTRKLTEGKGKTEEIINTKKPIFHSTQKEADDWYSQSGRENYTHHASPSWIGVPMINDDNVIGVIATYSERENVYSADDLTTLQTIANQAAIALVNARSFVKINKFSKAMAEFGEASSNQRRREPEILDLIHDQVGELMLTESMYVALCDDDVSTIRFGIAYENGKPKDMPSRNVDKENRSMVEEIILTKQPIFISSKKESIDWHNQPGHQKSADGLPNASWLGVPIMLGNEVWGVIVVYHQEKEFVYSSDDLFILKNLSNLAAIALDNAHQYYIIEQNLLALVDFGQQLTKQIKSNRKEILQSIYEKANTFLDAKNMFVAFCETEYENSETVRFDLVYRDNKLTKWDNRDAKIGRIGEIIHTKLPLLLATKTAISNWFQSHNERERVGETSSWLGVPMILEDKVLGVIGVSHPSKDHYYTKNHLKNLQALANYGAIAFENIRLFEEANAEIIAQKQLNTLGRAMAAIEHRINNTLNIIVPNINRLRKRVNASDPEIKEILEIIERNTRYTSLLIDKIRTFSLEFDYVDVNINAELHEIITKQKIDWALDSTHLMQVMPNFDADPEIPLVRLPIGQISEVFINLIQNAYKQLEKAQSKQHVQQVVQGVDRLVPSHWQAELFVSTSLAHGKIRVKIKDNVPGGIPQRIAERLFIKPVPAQTPGEGSGLGLWLSKMIMDSIGGIIKIEETTNTGTTILLEVPLQNNEEERK